jgi:N-methylhydantoinase B
MSGPAFDPVEFGILWDRLLSIADEIVSALVTTSFSTMVRESGDLSCMLFDASGRSLAQGAYSVPSFTGTGPPSMRHMLRRFPPNALEAGDVLITNDPWMGSGHLYDVTVVRPVFRSGRLVAFTMSVTHLPDIGGLGYGSTAKDIFEEGLYIPITKLIRRGEPDRDLFELIAGNVRLPDMVRGDLMANVTCNEVGGRLILEFMDEYGLEDLQALSHAIVERTEAAMRERIRAIEPGIYRNAITVEAFENPIELACAVRIEGGGVHIDFTGTGPAIPRGINVPLCYTRAFSNYSIKVLTIPELPNNEGAANPISIAAPEGCILNAVRPSPTGGRHVTGHFVAPLIFGALADAMPEQVQADSGMLTQFSFQGTHLNGRPISSLFFASGGFGALSGRDGRDATPGPSNMIGTPVEIWENETSMTVERKSLLPDSGGAGEFRGGNGQHIALRNDTGHPLTVSCFAGRTEFAPRGYKGGRNGALRQHRINGSVVHPKGRYVLLPGDVIEAIEAGGGGFGDPKRRERLKVVEEVRLGSLSAEAARCIYGVTVEPVAE